MKTFWIWVLVVLILSIGMGSFFVWSMMPKTPVTWLWFIPAQLIVQPAIYFWHKYFKDLILPKLKP